jgi:hypothetical protein
VPQRYAVGSIGASRAPDAARDERDPGRTPGYLIKCWTIPSFGDENVLWALSARVEHAAAGRLAHNVGATSVDHTEGKEWLRHDSIGDVDWPTEFHRAVCETLAFFGRDKADAGSRGRWSSPAARARQS